MRSLEDGQESCGGMYWSEDRQQWETKAERASHEAAAQAVADAESTLQDADHAIRAEQQEEVRTPQHA